MGRGAGPGDQVMGKVAEAAGAAVESFEDPRKVTCKLHVNYTVASYAEIRQPDMRRSACCCCWCSVCRIPHHPISQNKHCPTVGEVFQCCCCTYGKTCTFLDVTPMNRACTACECSNGCLDMRGSYFEICNRYCDCNFLCCCRDRYVFTGSFQNMRCIYAKQTLCCLNGACAFPCNTEVPFEIGLCGIMCKESPMIPSIPGAP